MATNNDYLLYVLDLLRELDGITYKKMMGEYILYRNGIIFGGIYDNRFLVKDNPKLKEYDFDKQIPYPSAKPMLLVDIEDADTIKDIVLLLTNNNCVAKK